ncbi:pyridoxamine 5'-phosphate oxidase family protein [Phytohabitans houttuyneae]|uniref:Pyridoxamine 5'-phosphate oxidase n=1 Tax=Phytohabitans houttuyneae TaxID=1076126 RepID=A0A6V8KLQ0_9ACTN|nr:pyridoxamine 5'-phosphate oxidase family protein [Phytohabitans houttuyneae]GFJ84350.1 pyridoxamine 5'-phosphate oxidase [Phytohabitans houttuyneae]
MARWERFEGEAPQLAAAVRRLLDAHRHKTLATLRRDGGPRISGTESEFRDGDLWFGSMWMARKAVDLRRDPRFALHSGSEDPPEGDPSTWPGDAKLSGRAVEVTDPRQVAAAHGGETPQERSHLFRADIDEVVWTRVGTPADHLLIDLWRPGAGVRQFKR